MRNILFVAILTVLSFVQAERNVVIGVMTQPKKNKTEGAYPEEYQYILEANEIFPEIGGAKVVPVMFDSTTEELDELLSKINGVLFTGGGLNLYDNITLEFTEYTQASQYIWNYAIDQNDNGNHFPLFGIC